MVARIKPNGYVLWQGKSRFTGDDIVAIVTLKTANRKTGNTIQSWILRADMDPVTAREFDQESANCNLCPLRNNNGCYVNVGQAPLAVFKAFQRGKYPELDSAGIDRMRGRVLRIGSYGDPTATPVKAWRPILNVCSAFVGYTHSPIAAWRPYLMASVETEAQAQRAQAKGWRTFRTRNPGSDSLASNEIVCPADTRGITCEQCKLCAGASIRARNIVIDAHGPTAVRMASLLK